MEVNIDFSIVWGDKDEENIETCACIEEEIVSKGVWGDDIGK